jgi:diguanylate cyclase (GGDEF)-like protein
MQTPNFDKTSLEQIWAFLSSEIARLLDTYDSLYLIVPGLTLLFSIYYLARGIYGKQRRNLENNAFIILCAAHIVIAATAILNMQYEEAFWGSGVAILGNFAFLSLPVIFCFHTWTQVSYKPIKKIYVAFAMAIPVATAGIHIYLLATGEEHLDIWNFSVLRPMGLMTICFILLWALIGLKSLLLCFNVFYQMPRHMRDSTMLILSVIAMTTLLSILMISINSRDFFLVMLLNMIFTMNRSFKGFFRANSANVIATSREFVFGNLSTMVFILSRKGRILEWNSTEDRPVFSLLSPKYLQPFEHYRDKLLENFNGVVSPHDENIITLTVEGHEYHMLITKKIISEGKREFGNLVEIAEVTNIYSVLRYMESIATFDQLTGLYNRNAYMTLANKMIVPHNMPMLIIVGDVNNLKKVNDTIGHLCGDRLLMCISGIIKEVAPPEAFICRVGGDEMLLLIPNADESTAQEFTWQAYERMETVYDAEFGKPSISWGWAVMSSVEDDYNLLFKQADEKMYLQKKAYKSKYESTLSGTLPSMAIESGDPDDPASMAASATIRLDRATFNTINADNDIVNIAADTCDESAASSPVIDGVAGPSALDH